MLNSSKKVLYIPLEFTSWNSARYWSYSYPWGIEEILRKECAECLTVPSLFGLPSYSPRSWLYYLKDLCCDKKFDQVWFTANHTELDDHLLEQLSEQIPVRVALFTESLVISEEEWKSNPNGCIQRNQIAERCLRHATHAVVPDETDVDLLKQSNIPAYWLPAVISSRFISEEPGPALHDHAVFFGALYGNRSWFLNHPALAGLLVRPDQSLEENTVLPMQFNQLHEIVAQQLDAGNASQLLLDTYLAELRSIRTECFHLWLKTLAEAPVVVNLPQFGSMYSGRVAEAIAAGRPVVAARISGRPETQELLMEDRDILLYDADDPLQLAEKIKKLMADNDYAKTVAHNAQRRLRKFGLAEHHVRAIFDWIDSSTSGMECQEYYPSERIHEPVKQNLPGRLVVYPHSGFSNRLKGQISASLFDEDYKVFWQPERFCGLRYGDLFCDTHRVIEQLPADALLLDTWRFELPNQLHAIIAPGFSDCSTGYKGIDFPGDSQARNIDFEYFKIPSQILAALKQKFAQIRFSKIIMDRVNARLREMPDSYVGVHARTWFDEPERKQKWFNFDDFVKVCSRFQDQELFVTSDDPLFVENLSRVLNKKLLTSEKIIQRPSKPWYQNSPDEMLDDIVELLVLSRASHLVLTAMSTYSEVAWFLGGCIEEIYFADPDFQHKGLGRDYLHTDRIVRDKLAEQVVTWIEVAGNPSYYLALLPGQHLHLDSLGGGAHRIADYVEKYSGYLMGSASDDYMIDVGANLGLASFPVALMQRRVVAFEPVAENVAAMKRSIIRNNFHNVTLVESAVSSQIGMTKIYVPLGRADNASFGEDVANANVSSPEVFALPVATETIDHWFEGHSREFRPGDARLLKIDVQGYETAVLQGAKVFISACRPFEKLIIEFEFDPKLTKMAGYSPLGLLELIKSYGLEIYYNGNRISSDCYADFCRQEINCDLIAVFCSAGDAEQGSGRNFNYNAGKMKLGDSMYGQDFYNSQIFGSLQSAQVYLYHLFSIWGVPESAVDIGCGRGAWLATCRDFGVKRVVGVDGGWNSQEAMLDSCIEFHPANLEKELPLSGPFDLAISLEVAEHLQPESSEAFVESISSLSDVVLFGAAFTGQPGVNHINTRPHSFWAGLFYERGYVLFDLFRPAFWNDERVEPCYRQNTFLYVKPDHHLYHALLNQGVACSLKNPFIDCVHPEVYLGLLKEFTRLRQSSAETPLNRPLQDECSSAGTRVVSLAKQAGIEILIEKGAAQVKLNLLADAADTLRLALAQEPDNPECLLRLSHVLLRMKCYEESFHHARHFLRIVDDVSFGYYLAGHGAREIGRWHDSRSYLLRAVKLDPAHIYARVLCCMSAFTMCMDPVEAESMLQTYAAELDKLVRDASLETPEQINNAVEGIGALTPFFLPYLGGDVKDLQSKYGAWICAVMAAKYPGFTTVLPQRSSRGKIRVGIVSNYFHNHSNWKIPIRGWLEQLDRRLFSIHCFHTGEICDQATESARSLADSFLQSSDTEALAAAILEQDFDLLIYPGIGMDTAGVKLAALRLAPVQCASWGHPVTTGMPTVDYFISSDLMEPTDGDKHYSERLVRLPNLSIWYEPPGPELDISPTLTIPGLKEHDVMFLCCQNLLKYLPEYDSVFPAIAKGVENARFVFISNPIFELTEKFVRRLELAFKSQGLNATDFISLSPQLDAASFAALNARADIFLDSIEWSGCNTIFESLPFNKPIVTMPGTFMRGRHGYAILKLMGIEETIAASTEEYIAIAVRLANARQERDAVSARICGNKNKIYRDTECIKELERFLIKISGRSPCEVDADA